MRRIWIVASLACLLVSCGPHSYWTNFYNPWETSCPDFPSREEAEEIVEDQHDFFAELEGKDLINWVEVHTCPGGAYIVISHNGQGQIAPVLESMDEIRALSEGLDRFFGIPFRFVNV